MEEIFNKKLLDPPSKYVHERKKIKLNDKGEIVGNPVYYFTANLFYDGTHWATKNLIMKIAKEWIYEHIKDIPPLEKANIVLTYYHNTDGFDLDNKLYFWVKVLLDVMKTPSPLQLANSIEYENEIITINCLKDDSVKYVNDIHMKYERGTPALEIKITGRVAAIQSTLF